MTQHEIVRAARAALSKGEWDYLIGGANSETTLRRNRLALDSIAFRPRILCDVSQVDCSSTLLGHRLPMPVVLAPLGALETLHPGAGLDAAKGAERFGTISMLSSVSEPSLETVAAETANPKIFQLYVRGDDEWVADMGKRAVHAGYSAFCFTVDVAHYGRRERDIIKRYEPGARRHSTPEGSRFQSSFTWDHVRRFKDRFDIPVAIKGIATAEDAAMALECGVEIVYISNHGGRQLDHGRGTIEMLPEIVSTVGGKADIIIDGGFYRGGDVLKAIALGASAVAIGRSYGYGLAAGGADGVAQVLDIFKTEITADMGNLGVSRLDQLDDSYLHPAAPTNEPHVFSAFQLLNLDDKGY